VEAKPRALREIPEIITLGSFDYFLSNLPAERQPESDISWEVDAGPDADGCIGPRRHASQASARRRTGQTFEVALPPHRVMASCA